MVDGHEASARQEVEQRYVAVRHKQNNQDYKPHDCPTVMHISLLLAFLVYSVMFQLSSFHKRVAKPLGLVR
jgi:hypothetical protein